MKSEIDPQEKERLRPRLMEFAEKYVFPWMLDYLTGLDISTVGRIDRQARAEEKGDACFVVYLKKYPPKSRRRLVERDGGIRAYWIVPKKRERRMFDGDERETFERSVFEDQTRSQH